MKSKRSRVHFAPDFRSETGAAIVEAVICMIILMLLLFGLLQLAIIFASQEAVDYAAFRAGRSAAVGFTESVVFDEFKVRSIPAAGKLLFPEPAILPEDNSFYGRVKAEKMQIRDYVTGIKDIEYDYWSSGSSMSSSFSGQDNSVNRNRAAPAVSISRSDKKLTVRCAYKNYPLIMPFASAFIERNASTGLPELDLQSDYTMTDYSNAYIE